ncbi:MAG: hypothetical protein WD423_09645 [Rhodothermales bacterium]
MNIFWKVLSAFGIGLTVLPSFFVFAGSISWQTHANLMLAGTVLWFATAPLWMEGTTQAPATDIDPN